MRVINSNIYKDPYGEKEFLQMSQKIDTLCFEDFTTNYLKILKKELEHIDNKNKKLFNKKTQKELNERMQEYIKQSPCAEIFYRSVFKELLKSHINEPITNILYYIDKLTIMSKNSAT